MIFFKQFSITLTFVVISVWANSKPMDICKKLTETSIAYTEVAKSFINNTSTDTQPESIKGDYIDKLKEVKAEIKNELNFELEELSEENLLLAAFNTVNIFNTYQTTNPESNRSIDHFCAFYTESDSYKKFFSSVFSIKYTG